MFTSTGSSSKSTSSTPGTSTSTSTATSKATMALPTSRTSSTLSTARAVTAARDRRKYTNTNTKRDAHHSRNTQLAKQLGHFIAVLTAGAPGSALFQATNTQDPEQRETHIKNYDRMHQQTISDVREFIQTFKYTKDTRKDREHELRTAVNQKFPPFYALNALRAEDDDFFAEKQKIIKDIGRDKIKEIYQRADFYDQATLDTITGDDRKHRIYTQLMDEFVTKDSDPTQSASYEAAIAGVISGDMDVMPNHGMNHIPIGCNYFLPGKCKDCKTAKTTKPCELCAEKQPLQYFAGCTLPEHIQYPETTEHFEFIEVTATNAVPFAKLLEGDTPRDKDKIKDTKTGKTIINPKFNSYTAAYKRGSTTIFSQDPKTDKHTNTVLNTYLNKLNSYINITWTRGSKHLQLVLQSHRRQYNDYTALKRRRRLLNKTKKHTL